MPAIVRSGVDRSAEHDHNPGGQIEPPANRVFTGGSPNVFLEGHNLIRVTDKTICGDEAASGSANVFVNGLAAHRIGDTITVHPGGSPATTVAESVGAACTIVAN